MLIGIGHIIAIARGVASRTKAPDHTLSVGVAGVSVSLQPIEYVNGHHEHTISAAVTGVTVSLLDA